MRKIHTRPFISQDKELLDKIRFGYFEADLELPKGYVAPGVRTAVAEKTLDDGTRQFVAALTGTLAVILDPFIKNPEAERLDVMEALIKLEAVVSYMGAQSNAVDAYIAIPDNLPEYQALVQKYGYQQTVENCTVYRRPINADTEPLIGKIRDMMLDKAALDGVK